LAISASTSRSHAEPGERVPFPLAPDQVGHQVGVHDATVCDTAYVERERAQVGDPVPEEVTDRTVEFLHQAQRSVHFDVPGEEHQPDRELVRADLDGRPHLLVGVPRRHPQVDDDDVGTLGPGQRDHGQLTFTREVDCNRYSGDSDTAGFTTRQHDSGCAPSVEQQKGASSNRCISSSAKLAVR
jgi:hypothetical protein